jgi:transcriptional regulator with XRE-family HTH domain
MKLSAKIRQLRYAKGWGPDDLASRANISRTALYQIESGRTEWPRAATLRRIARALDVAPETLLAEDGAQEEPAQELETAQNGHDRAAAISAPVPPAPVLEPAAPMDLMKEIEVERKFRILLRSPLRDALVKIVEQSYSLLPASSRDLAV